MITELFSVFDMAAKRFIDPFCAPSHEFAIRGFREACETEGHQFHKFPEDYALYHVGTFEGELGALIGVEASKIALAISYVGLDSARNTVSDLRDALEA